MASCLLVSGQIHESSLLLILVYAHEVEPVVFLCCRLEELDLAVTECPEKSFIPDIAHAVQGQLRVSFLQQYWLDLDVVGFRCASVVIDQTRNLQDIKCSIVPFLDLL